MVWNSKKVTFINEQNWRNTVRAVAPVYSANDANQDLSLFLEHFGGRFQCGGKRKFQNR